VPAANRSCFSSTAAAREAEEKASSVAAVRQMMIEEAGFMAGFSEA
jgi:hypothetical protein